LMRAASPWNADDGRDNDRELCKIRQRQNV
jgi:hypothetical protein